MSRRMLALGVVKHAVLGALMASATVFIASELGYRDWSIWLYYLLWPAYLSICYAPDTQLWIEQCKAEQKWNLAQSKFDFAELCRQVKLQVVGQWLTAWQQIVSPYLRWEAKLVEQMARQEQRRKQERQREAVERVQREQKKAAERERKAAERAQREQRKAAERARREEQKAAKRRRKAVMQTYRKYERAAVRRHQMAEQARVENAVPPQPKQRETGSVAGAVLWYLAYKQAKGEGSEGVEKVKRAATGHGVKDWFNRRS